MAAVRLIEDDETQLEVRRMILEHAGHTVVGDGENADAVVMDLHVPTLEDGLGLIRNLSAEGKRICVLSGFTHDLKGRPEEQLVHQVIAKPARTELLLKWLAMLLLLLLPAAAQTLELQVAKTSEVAVELELSSPGSSWAKEGKEAALAAVYLDDARAPQQHVMVFAGERVHRYPVFLGSIAAGKHTVRIERDSRFSASGSGLKVHGLRQISSIAADVLARAPVLYARRNTIGKFTDIPLIVYAERLEGKSLQYTVIFSNEDGGTATRALMARWGRTTDIEYVYRLDLASNKAIIQGKGHEDIPYDGPLEGLHPVLAPVTDNNMVGAGETSEIRYQIAPVEVDLTHDSRESVMDRFPWSYRIAAEEMEREGKLGLIGDPRGYLMIETPIENHATAVVAVARVGQIARLYSSHIGREPMAMERDAIIRTTVQLPKGARPEEIDSVGFTCLVLTKRPPVTDAGPCVAGAGVKLFMLDADYRPLRIPGRWERAPRTVIQPGETVLFNR